MKKIITIMCTVLLATLVALPTSVIASDKKTLQVVIHDTGPETASATDRKTFGPFDVSGFREVRVYVHTSAATSPQEVASVSVTSDVGGSPAFLDHFFLEPHSTANFLYSTMGPAITIEVGEGVGAGGVIAFRLILFGSQ